MINKLLLMAALLPLTAQAAERAAYDIRSSLHIVVNDLGKWRDIMQALLAMPNLDQLSTRFGRKDRLQAERELTAAAVQDARRRADAMAAGIGKQQGGRSAPSRRASCAI